MNFLIESDYLHLIRKAVLDVVVNDSALRLDAEIAAEAEAESYLNTKYDTAIIFRKPAIWETTVAYNFNQLIVLQADLYDNTTDYADEDLIEFQGEIWKAKNDPSPGEDPVSDPSKWDLIGTVDAFFAALLTQFFKLGVIYNPGEFVEFKGKRYEVDVITTGIELPTDTNFFTLNTDTVPPGTLPSNTTFYTPGDTRNALVKRHVIDITLYELHSRINPRNIPELRIQRRDDAIKYLMNVADPRKNINPV